jgi:hypothetical protein
MTPAPVILTHHVRLGYRVGWIIDTDARTGWAVVEVARIGRERRRKQLCIPYDWLKPWTPENEAILKDAGAWQLPKDTHPEKEILHA